MKLKTSEQANQAWEYDAITGVLHRKKISTSTQGVAGCLRNDGYINVKYKGTSYLAHRVVWLIMTGHWPVDKLDHIDGNKTNNRIDNLRECSQAQNTCNKKLGKDNTSGIKGIHWSKACKKWLVQLSIDGKKKYFGVYEDKELAELVAIEARDKYHKEFARHE